MHQVVVVDTDRAQTQWDDLVTLLRAAGAAVEVLDPVEGFPDLVFTANAGIVNGGQFVPANFRHPQRQGETPIDVAWFEAHGWQVTRLPPEVRHEGAGDALPFGSALVSGYRWRSDAQSHHELSRITGWPVRSVELVDTRFYHLDITFCPLDSLHAITVPEAWDSYGHRVVQELVPEPLECTLEEGLDFVANSVVVGRNIVMPVCPPRVGRQLEAWGFEVAVADVSEFMKAGGAVRCLTLALDVG
jgi:N-dimethylarginine dimethylaminohydrolase